MSVMPNASPLLSYYNLTLLMQGVGFTLILSVAGSLAGFCIGFLLAVARLTHSKPMAPLRAAIFGYCLLLRRVPFLVTLMLVFFLSQWSGADLPTLAVALLSGTLMASAYLAEVVRSALMTVPANQWDAAATLNFGYVRTLRHVILPQAWHVMVPPIVGFLVLFIKDTALASQLGVMELTSAGKVLNDKGYMPVQVYGLVLILYFLISYPLTRFGKRLERRLAAARVR